MSFNTLTLLRNILLRATVVCMGLAWIMSILTVCFWDTWTATTSSLFRIEPKKLGPLIAYFFAFAKLYVIFILLAPGLAIHWTLQKDGGLLNK